MTKTPLLPTRRPYSTPTLQEFGSVTALTQEFSATGLAASVSVTISGVVKV